MGIQEAEVEREKLWDEEAREAVVGVLEEARWIVGRGVFLCNCNDPPYKRVFCLVHHAASDEKALELGEPISSLSVLETALAEVFDTDFVANAPSWLMGRYDSYEEVFDILAAEPWATKISEVFPGGE